MTTQKQNTCRVYKIPKSLGMHHLYEVRCTPKKSNRLILFDAENKKEANKAARKVAKEYGIKKIYFVK